MKGSEKLEISRWGDIHQPKIVPIRVVIASVVIAAAAAAAVGESRADVAVVVARRGVAVMVAVIEVLEPLCPSLVMK